VNPSESDPEFVKFDRNFARQLPRLDNGRQDDSLFWTRAVSPND